ncbi:UPF0721 transmembrane protein [Pseudoclavibacter endophyticus]|uniref:Probable membrane transporter protein n=1 Tax=Pseudoclavibacter endophyticus TaxID=1778590 RepID=A0A6H9WPZ0_9MICO|nr:sulfite exporter TauE/SafE family protein [Pseudoclavibacter endophyticus]KAB1649771.1 sulfite exporter TauE/SafE family protein [Pseudoclavibacter endophyticus]GGA59868.1 UPF0721 transmembrane protein [Pseudoclavibacter endophyticus]
MPDLVGLHGWPALVALAAAAVVIGFSKTSFGGVAAISVAVFAFVMPAKESTATVLLLLIVGDLVAVARYRRVRWRLLPRLLPAVVPGLLLGALFMNLVDDTVMKLTIGGLLLVMVLIQLRPRLRGRSQRRVSSDEPPHGPTSAAAGPGWPVQIGAGVAAGFTTMTANAAGPFMALYFLAARIDKMQFIGTNAWFFCIVNISKVPLAASLGLYTGEGLWLVLLLIPLVLAGTVVGVSVIKRVSQRQFEIVTLVASAIAAVSLLVL